MMHSLFSQFLQDRTDVPLEISVFNWLDSVATVDSDLDFISSNNTCNLSDFERAFEENSFLLLPY